MAHRSPAQVGGRRGCRVEEVGLGSSLAWGEGGWYGEDGVEED